MRNLLNTKDSFIDKLKKSIKELSDVLSNKSVTEEELVLMQGAMNKWSKILFKKNNFSYFDVNCNCKCGELTKRIEECSFCSSEDIKIKNIEFVKND
jgi:hypothetical protein